MNTKALERARDMTLEYASKERDPSIVLDLFSWGKKTECGCIACIGGFMTLDPELQSMGLFNLGDAGMATPEGALEFTPCYQGYTAMSALTNFLDITSEATKHLFGSHNPNNWEDAADRFQEVLDGKIG